MRFLRHNLPYRPPLAKELFGTGDEYMFAVSRFPVVRDVIPRLQGLPDGGSIEAELERLQAEIIDDTRRMQQWAGIRYYLHFLIWDFTQHWEHEVARGITNYNTLFDDIRRWRRRGERVCFVTFNYDKMLESALPTLGLGVTSISDYIASDDLKVIKIHGSANWAREVERPIIDDLGNLNDWQVAYRLIEAAPELRLSQRYRLVTEWPIGKADDRVLFPALAIPHETGLEFECPEDHLAALRACIPEVTMLLVIGWGAADQPFLELLAQLPQRPRVMVVAGSQATGEEIRGRLDRAIVAGRYSVSSSGFTQFVLDREFEQWLRR
jgi:hypothetical protein